MAEKQRSRSDGLTADDLRRLVDYDPETGIFTWKISRRGVNAGERSGCVNAEGYVLIGVCKKLYLAHRLAWLYMTGTWPECTIDHRNGQRSDNRWVNLRPATYSENNANTGLRGNNSSGVTGVAFERRRKRWRAYITTGKRRLELGRFDTIEQAIAVRRASEIEHFGAYRFGAELIAA